MELYNWMSEWQKGKTGAKETRMQRLNNAQMRASKSMAFSRPLCKRENPLGAEIAHVGAGLMPAWSS